MDAPCGLGHSYIHVMFAKTRTRQTGAGAYMQA